MSNDEHDDSDGRSADFVGGRSAAELLIERYESAAQLDVTVLRAEVGALRKEVDGLRRELLRVGRGHESNARSIRQQRVDIDQMRLDRQIRSAPRWVATRLRQRSAQTGGSDPTLPRRGVSGRSTLLLLAHAYPVGDAVYGGQPLARRVPWYIEAGFSVVVAAPPRGDQSPGAYEGLYGESVLLRPFSELPDLLGSMTIDLLAVHSPTPEIWALAEPLAASVPTAVWMHGFESRSWRDLIFDFEASEVAARQDSLDVVDVERQRLLGRIFADTAIHKVFVSSYMHSVAERFVGVRAEPSAVIHNVVDPTLFPYRPRSEEDRFGIAMIRSFDRRNYATDLASLALQLLAEQPDFDRFRVRVVGDGKYFDEDTAALTGFSNIVLDRGFAAAPDVASALAGAGLALLPTRWDSQGMLMGEAMSTGAVPITNTAAAIPEFVDESCAVLAPYDDYEQLAEGILRLAAEPAKFIELSANAHERVLLQCGPNNTVGREIELLRQLQSV